MAQAPNMYITWANNKQYDYIMVDWYCEEDAVGTYWAVGRWWRGYAGFMNAASNHKLLMALWDLTDEAGNTFLPEIEYLSPKSDIQDLSFGNEGTGKHIFTNYPWENNTWYTMCIGTKSICGKTYYAQWVRKVENGAEWYLAAMISSPINTVGNYKLDRMFMFQEDFGKNDLSRKCRMKNAYGHLSSTNTWESLRNCTITNTKYNSDNTYVDNVDYDCDWAKQNSTYVWVKSGGGTPALGINPPQSFSFTNSQPFSPISIPSWSDLLPKYIKSTYSNLYANPSANKVIQNNTPYLWYFIDSNDGYFHILNQEQTKAITISGTGNGADLILSDFDITANNQKWTKSSAHDDVFYIRPKLAPTKYMDIEGPSTQSGAFLQIWTSDPPAPQYKWQLGNIIEEVAIKNLYSHLYMNPSGTAVRQKSNVYMWHFVHAGDGEYYILNPDHTKAVAISGTTNGKDLILKNFSITDETQKWNRLNAGNDLYYIIPKSASSMTIDVEGPSQNENAIIQIWTRNTTAPQFKWEFIA